MQQDDLLNSSFSQEKGTSEKLKARQYGTAALLSILVVIIMTIIRWIWGSVTIGSEQDEVSLSFIIYWIRNVVLIFGAIDLISAVYHFALWNRNGRPCLDDDNNGLLSDWKGGVRSPIKVSLALMAGIAVLVLIIIVQG